MSAPNAGAGTSDGVVRNSALAFLASAQPAVEGGSQEAQETGQAAERQMPAGLRALCEAYSKLYPDQPNPLQVTTRLKYWLGGHDPLDYISMYYNPGKPEEHIPPHWHYVSFGLSDLHGDGRVHVPSSGVSGVGCELTFRLSAERAGAPPPLWPAALLQALARYCFSTGNTFLAGDHISWHAALDGAPTSRVRHLLVADDPQLKPIDTPHGTVKFLQMVGCTGKELRAAQRGSGFEVLKRIAEDPNCGGAWLVTLVWRRAARRVGARGTRGAAELAGVSARLRWAPLADTRPPTQHSEGPSASPELSPSVERQIKETLQRGLSTMSTERSGPEGHTGMSTDSFEMSSIERALPKIPEVMQGSWRGDESVEYLNGVHLFLNPEGASLLPLAIDGRVLHGSHFTWRCGALAVTVLAGGVSAARASPARPYAAAGCWLQILIPNALAREMSKTVAKLSTLSETDSETDSEEERDKEPLTLPLHFSWPEYRLKISVVADCELL